MLGLLFHCQLSLLLGKSNLPERKCFSSFFQSLFRNPPLSIFEIPANPCFQFLGCFSKCLPFFPSRKSSNDMRVCCLCLSMTHLAQMGIRQSLHYISQTDLPWPTHSTCVTLSVDVCKVKPTISWLVPLSDKCFDVHSRNSVNRQSRQRWSPGFSQRLQRTTSCANVTDVVIFQNLRITSFKRVRIKMFFFFTFGLSLFYVI